MDVWIKRSAYMHTKQCNIMTYTNQSNEGTNHMVTIILQIRKAEQVNILSNLSWTEKINRSRWKSEDFPFYFEKTRRNFSPLV